MKNTTEAPPAQSETGRTLPIPGFRDYIISEYGDVYRLTDKKGSYMGVHNPPRKLKPSFRNGYASFQLSQDGRVRLQQAGRLVLTAFVGPAPSDKHEAAHLDNNPGNNHVSNLVWATHQENEAHKKLHGTKAMGERNGSAKLTAEDVLEIRKLSALGAKGCDLAKRFRVGKSQVSSIILNQKWRHVA